MNTDTILTLARKHLGNNAVMESSARLCLETAIQQYDYGQVETAKMWAIKSLSYSVGVFHADYKRANSGK